jgi:hypothetical protein
MTDDLRASLEQIASGAARALPPVEVHTVRRRLRRLRTLHRSAGVAGVLLVVSAVGAGAVTLGGATGPAELGAAELGAADPTATTGPSASASATEPAPPSTTPAADQAPWGEPCGAVPAVELRDSATLEIQGAVHPGFLDRTTAVFDYAADGDVLLLDVATTTETPGLAADGSTGVRVLVLDDTGTVVLWNDTAHAIPTIDAADGSGMSSLSWLFESRDCRTGQPLDGTYRVLASDGDETVDLAPLHLGSAAGPADELVGVGRAIQPTCGAVLADEALAQQALADPDLRVSFGTGAALDGVQIAGLHAPVTLTATDGPLRGRVPQGLRAFLVDDAGTVVSETRLPWAPSGATWATPFDVDAGGSFGSEVFQWFQQCATPGSTPLVAGTYDLYVLDGVVATDASGDLAERTVAGGPFPITLTGTW